MAALIRRRASASDSRPSRGTPRQGSPHDRPIPETCSIPGRGASGRRSGSWAGCVPLTRLAPLFRFGGSFPLAPGGAVAGQDTWEGRAQRKTYFDTKGVAILDLGQCEVRNFGMRGEESVNVPEESGDEPSVRALYPSSQPFRFPYRT